MRFSSHAIQLQARILFSSVGGRKSLVRSWQPSIIRQHNGEHLTATVIDREDAKADETQHEVPPRDNRKTNFKLEEAI